MHGQPLTHRRIAKFYVPLALSWIFMAIESPICVSIISRLPQPILAAAAFQVLMPLAIWIESPVIDLLSTSTTLNKSRRDYVLISRFVWYLLLGVTAVHALIVYTPLYDIVTKRMFSYPEQPADYARLGLMVMLPWSASIGWRRYLQGILIRNNRTRMIGFGTAVRVSTVGTIGFLLYLLSPLPSIEIVGIALICSVAAEAGFAHWASRPVVRQQYAPSLGDHPRTELASAPATPPDITPEPASAEFGAVASDPSPAASVELQEEARRDGALNMRRLVAFHAPLTLTTMVTLVGNPIVGAFLSRTPDPAAANLALASWSVSMTLAWLMRTITYALPEVVIALYDGEESARVLRRFCIGIGVGTTSVMLLFALTGLDGLFFAKVIGAKPEVVQVARLAFVSCSLLPFLGAAQSYVRGMLTAHHLTVSRLLAIGVAMVFLVSFLYVGLFLPVPPVIAASLALTVSMTAELAVLIMSWKRGKAGVLARAAA